jgi:hypothetical protein
MVPSPPSGLALSPYRATTVEFPELAWDPTLFAVTVLAEFVGATVGGQDWLSHTGASIPTIQSQIAANTVNVSNELDELQRLAEYRPEVLSEAIAQMNDFSGFWGGLLMFSPASHPWTFRLVRIGIVVGEFVAMHYKRSNKRARPSQLSPTLMPPIAVPGHASYPSGHATQAYLTSRLLSQVMPGVVTTALSPLGTAMPGSGPARSLLNRLADRIARNREVLGVHYPSDSSAGQSLASATFDLLLQCSLVTLAITNAQAEWP